MTSEELLDKWFRQRLWTGTCDSVEWQRTAGQCDCGPRDECRCWPDDLEDVMWDEACALVEGERNHE